LSLALSLVSFYPMDKPPSTPPYLFIAYSSVSRDDCEDVFHASPLLFSDSENPYGRVSQSLSPSTLPSCPPQGNTNPHDRCYLGSMAFLATLFLMPSRSTPPMMTPPTLSALSPFFQSRRFLPEGDPLKRDPAKGFFWQIYLVPCFRFKFLCLLVFPPYLFFPIAPLRRVIHFTSLIPFKFFSLPLRPWKSGSVFFSFSR